MTNISDNLFNVDKPKKGKIQGQGRATNYEFSVEHASSPSQLHACRISSTSKYFQSTVKKVTFSCKKGTIDIFGPDKEQTHKYLLVYEQTHKYRNCILISKVYSYASNQNYNSLPITFFFSFFNVFFKKLIYKEIYIVNKLTQTKTT